MNPYAGLEPRAFWRTAVAEVGTLGVEVANPPQQLLSRADGVGTAGSCFAQHIARALRANGFNFVDVEPAPALLPIADHQKHGYGLYSARYGNVYTTIQLRQLVERAF